MDCDQALFEIRVVRYVSIVVVLLLVTVSLPFPLLIDLTLAAIVTIEDFLQDLLAKCHRL